MVGRILDMLIWLVVTLFSPQAGLNEIKEDTIKGQNDENKNR